MDVTSLLGRLAANGTPADPDDLVPDDISGLDDLLEADPPPRRAADGSGRGMADKLKKVGAGGTPAKVTAKQKREIQDALEMIQLVIGGGIQIRDPFCGSAIVDNAENAAARAVPIICRNPKWVAWFTGTTGWMDVFGLLLALKPVGEVWWGHHVSHTIGHGEGEDAGDDDYSAYTAPAL